MENHLDLTWNLPEQKTGTLNILGGNSQLFKTPIKVAENAISSTHFKTIITTLPDDLKTKLPPLDNLAFLPSTASGSFADAASVQQALGAADSNLIIGDLSKNSITAKIMTEALTKTTKPALITRDTVDLISTMHPDALLMNEHITILASLAQLQKLFRSVYYPKVLLLSMPLLQITEALHKFTLSYPVSIITFHEGQIIIAKDGKIATVPSVKTAYSPITLWQGDLALKIIDYNFFNPNNFIAATTSAIF